MILLPSVAATIGQAPLVTLDRLVRGLPGRVLAKLETANPGGGVRIRSLSCLRTFGEGRVRRRREVARPA